MWYFHEHGSIEFGNTGIQPIHTNQFYRTLKIEKAHEYNKQVFCSSGYLIK